MRGYLILCGMINNSLEVGDFSSQCGLLLLESEQVVINSRWIIRGNGSVRLCPLAKCEHIWSHSAKKKSCKKRFYRFNLPGWYHNLNTHPNLNTDFDLTLTLCFCDRTMTLKKYYFLLLQLSLLTFTLSLARWSTLALRSSNSDLICCFSFSSLILWFGKLWRKEEKQTL